MPTISSAAQHYRNIFESRTPEEMRTLAHMKRFMERLLADKDFRAALAENLEQPRRVAEQYGIDIDPLEAVPLWQGTHLKYRNTPECAPWPLAVAWDKYMSEMLRHRDMLREEGDMSLSNPRFHAWRERQIQRCNSELGGSAQSVTHPVICFELSEGCTVGCWFCGLSADRFKGHWDYSPEHAAMWRGVVGVANDVFGSAARTGFCYWATDPCDNPDYDRFLLDYYEITGALPQTTTAAPLKNIELTRRVMGLFDKYRTVTNRFSVLTQKQLNQIHSTFSPEELMGVELVMQSKDSWTSKADAGRAAERREKLRAAGKDDKIALQNVDHTTIACVSGFLVSMMRGRVQLITPVPGSKRWPLGYRIVAERFFKTVEEFRDAIEGIIDEHMQPGLPADRPVQFRRDLAYEPGDGQFMLHSRRLDHTVRDRAGRQSVGELIARGTYTPAELISSVTEDGSEVLAVADLLDQMFDAGILEEDLDDRFAGQTNEGLEVRAETSRRALERMGAPVAGSD